MIDTAHYSILIFWSDEDQAYLVGLPQWADRVLGPVTHGDTYEEAAQRGREALDALIASAQQHGEPLPRPRTSASL
jgi:predicted RNase H-like HicB family nuclease